MEQKLAKVTDITGKTFDFVIIGGGLSGLTVAARLSENPSVSVAVLEAGNAHFDDPLVVQPMGWPRQFMNPEYDWSFLTVPQAHVNGKPQLWFRGKGLGGSSGMNFLIWTRPQREDIDAIEALGTLGWDWEKLFAYSKNTEKFVPASQPAPEDFHGPLGSKGPVSVSFTDTISGAELPYRKSLEENGVATSQDPFSGKVSGAFKTLSIVDPTTNTRSYATTAYLVPALDRPNLKVLTGAYVTKLVLTKGADGQAVATGVEFEHGGQTHVVSVQREAILAAGAIKSPQVLELSGVGDKAILEPLGIEVKVDLPGVGANVQEHITHTALSFEMQESANIITSDLLQNPEWYQKLSKAHPERRQPLSLTFTSLSFVPLQKMTDRAGEIIAKLEAKIAREAAAYPPGLREQYEYQLKMLKDPEVADVEIMVTPFAFTPVPAQKPIIHILPTVVHPFSRGTIHVASADPKAPPAIDPKYFKEDVDLDIFVETWKFARKVAGTGAFKDITVGEASPGPAIQTDEQIRAHIKENIATTWHTSGSLSMLPKEKGGVVDAKLKVYGTKNIRVVDYSIVPIAITTHSQATVYAMAEQGADIIKAEHSL